MPLSPSALRAPRSSQVRSRRSARSLTAAGLAATVGLIGGLAILAWRDPTPRFLERRSHLTTVREGTAELIEGYSIRSVHLAAASGLAVDLLLKQPVAPPSLAVGGASAPNRTAETPHTMTVAEKRPLVLLLGGHNTGRDAARLIPETRGAIVAALNYPYRGEHRVKGLKVLQYVPAIRDAVLDTPPAVMLALDYLLSRPDADSLRVEAIGVSLGAPFVVIAGALDHRITRVWSIDGSGGSYGPLELNLRRSIPFTPVRAAVAGLATILISGPRLAPEQWVGRITPRPFVMINAREDERMPRPLIDRLYATANQPKSIIWVPGGHVRPRPEIVRPLMDTVLTRMFASP